MNAETSEIARLMTTPELMESIGLTKNQLQSMRRNGIITPENPTEKRAFLWDFAKVFAVLIARMERKAALHATSEERRKEKMRQRYHARGYNERRKNKKQANGNGPTATETVGA